MTVKQSLKPDRYKIRDTPMATIYVVALAFPIALVVAAVPYLVWLNINNNRRLSSLSKDELEREEADAQPFQP